MIRALKVTFVAVLALSLGLVMGCQPKVEVKTGTRVVCTEGHVISQNVKTVDIPANEIGSYRVKTVVRTCDEHAKIAVLYQDAQKAIATGDIQTAQAKLAEVVAADPAYRKAKSQLADIDSKREPVVDKDDTSKPAPDTTNTKPDNGEMATPAASLLKWAPDSLDGYKAAKPVLDPLNIAREYAPISGGRITSFVIVAEQSRTAASAQQALASQVKQRYPSDDDALTVNGHKAYFGTDGRRYAVLGFTDGTVMVALEMTTSSGDSPKSLKSALVDAAKQLP